MHAARELPEAVDVEGRSRQTPRERAVEDLPVAQPHVLPPTNPCTRPYHHASEHDPAQGRLQTPPPVRLGCPIQSGLAPVRMDGMSPGRANGVAAASGVALQLLGASGWAHKASGLADGFARAHVAFAMTCASAQALGCVGRMATKAHPAM